MRSSFVSKIASIVLVVVSLILSLWLMEVGLRLYFHGTVFSPAGDRLCRDRHPVRGIFNRPNTICGMFKLSYAATAKINSHGIRGPEFDQEPKPSTYRILVVSDSHAFGSGVNDGEPWPEQMQAMLGSNRFEVINLSVAAYSNVQEYLWLVDEGLSYKPNMVIFSFTPSNDVQTNYYPLQTLFQNDSVRPYAVPDGIGGFTIENRYMKASTEQARKPDPVTMLLGFVAGPMVQRVVRQAIEVTTGGRKNDPNIWIGWPLLLEYSSADAEGGRTVADYERLWTEGWGATKAVIRAMRDKTEATGAKFVMFSFVGKMQGNPDYTARVQSALPNLKLDIEKPEREMRAFGEEANIPVLSIFDAVISAASAGDRNIYFEPDDEHMTAHGHQLVAKAVAADLRAKGLLPSP